MTVFRGLLLFDIAEDPIGDWENQLGYRGYIEVWKLKGTEKRITIEPDEDFNPETEEEYEGLAEECRLPWEVWIDDGQDWNVIGYGYGFDEADRIAKEYMREHPNG